MGVVDTIFIDEVIRETGNEPYTGNPTPNFLSGLRKILKGPCSRHKVNKEGGYYKENGDLYLLSYENSPLLKEREMYLFAVCPTKKSYFKRILKFGSNSLDNEDEKSELI